MAGPTQVKHGVIRQGSLGAVLHRAPALKPDLITTREAHATGAGGAEIPTSYSNRQYSSPKPVDYPRLGDSEGEHEEVGGIGVLGGITDPFRHTRLPLSFPTHWSRSIVCFSFASHFPQKPSAVHRCSSNVFELVTLMNEHTWPKGRSKSPVYPRRRSQASALVMNNGVRLRSFISAVGGLCRYVTVAISGHGAESSVQWGFLLTTGP